MVIAAKFTREPVNGPHSQCLGVSPSARFVVNLAAITIVHWCSRWMGPMHCPRWKPPDKANIHWCRSAMLSLSLVLGCFSPWSFLGLELWVLEGLVLGLKGPVFDKSLVKSNWLFKLQTSLYKYVIASNYTTLLLFSCITLHAKYNEAATFMCGIAY